MRYKNCPLCGLAVDVGSHWDCVFDLLEEWAKHQRIDAEDKRRLAEAEARAAPLAGGSEGVGGVELAQEKKEEVGNG